MAEEMEEAETQAANEEGESIKLENQSKCHKLSGGVATSENQRKRKIGGVRRAAWRKCGEMIIGVVVGNQKGGGAWRASACGAPHIANGGVETTAWQRQWHRARAQ